MNNRPVALFIVVLLASMLFAACSPATGPTPLLATPTPVPPPGSAPTQAGPATAVDVATIDVRPTATYPPGVTPLATPERPPIRTVPPDAAGIALTPDLPPTPDSFRVFGPGALDDPTLPYDNPAVRAAVVDLSTRLAVAAGGITLVSTDTTEVASNAPCGAQTLRDESNPSSGIELAAEINLDYDGDVYRYVVAGALGYYCGLNP